MTGYTVHTGASKKFVDGWDRVFGGSGSRSTKSAAKSRKKKTTSKKKK